MKYALFRTKSGKKLCIINILMFFPYNLTYIWIVIKIFKKSLDFYEKALGLKEVRRKEAVALTIYQ